MPELRKDPIVGRWVIIASERARRPGNFIDTNDNELEDEGEECSFCGGQREIIHTAGDVRVVFSEDSVSESAVSSSFISLMVISRYFGSQTPYGRL